MRHGDAGLAQPPEKTGKSAKSAGEAARECMFDADNAIVVPSTLAAAWEESLAAGQLSPGFPLSLVAAHVLKVQGTYKRASVALDETHERGGRAPGGGGAAA